MLQTNDFAPRFLTCMFAASSSVLQLVPSNVSDRYPDVFLDPEYFACRLNSRKAKGRGREDESRSYTSSHALSFRHRTLNPPLDVETMKPSQVCTQRWGTVLVFALKFDPVGDSDRRSPRDLRRSR